MPYVYSTATCTGTYVEYAPNSSDGLASAGYNKAIRKVTILGGNGVANRHLMTPRGAVTEISEADFEWLIKNPTFQRHVDAGFMSYEKGKKKADPEKRYRDMAKRDGSSPLTPKDFEKSDKSDDYNARMYTGIPTDRPL